MMAMSSTILRGVGQQLGDPRAAAAVLRELEDRRRDREAALARVMVVRRWPLRIDSGRSLSNQSFITGL